jgi:hypothetical protein
LNAVLYVVHPGMYSANSEATPLLLKELKRNLPTWPTVYHAMDIIANWVTPQHYDRDGAVTFYDHLVSLGKDHNAHLLLHNLDGEFGYQSGTSVLFSEKVLAHSVPQWPEGERIVIAHYSKNDMQDRLQVVRPLLPT